MASRGRRVGSWSSQAKTEEVEEDQMDLDGGIHHSQGRWKEANMGAMTRFTIARRDLRMDLGVCTVQQVWGVGGFEGDGAPSGRGWVGEREGIR